MTNIQLKSSKSISPKLKIWMDNHFFSKAGIENKTQNLLRFQEFKKKGLAETKINMNILKYLKMKTKIALKRKLTKEEEIVGQSDDIIEKNLDCLEILKKLQEIEKLKQIILDNIRSYEHQEINFAEGSTLLSGDIGSGKTSVLLAIEFALFGLQPGQRGSALLRNGKNEGKVKITFDVDGDEIIIERTLKILGKKKGMALPYIVG